MNVYLKTKISLITGLLLFVNSVFAQSFTNYNISLTDIGINNYTITLPSNTYGEITINGYWQTDSYVQKNAVQVPIQGEILVNTSYNKVRTKKGSS